MHDCHRSRALELAHVNTILWYFLFVRTRCERSSDYNRARPLESKARFLNCFYPILDQLPGSGLKRKYSDMETSSTGHPSNKSTGHPSAHTMHRPEPQRITLAQLQQRHLAGTSPGAKESARLNPISASHPSIMHHNSQVTQISATIKIFANL